MPERKTPQQKKALSYAKDRRNNYGANDKASRKNIPLRKAKQNRAFRKRANEILKKTIIGTDSEEQELVENKVRNVKKGDWKKCPDDQLGEFVEAKIERRKVKEGMGKTARSQIRKIVDDLEIEAIEEKVGSWVARSVKYTGINAQGNTRDQAIEKVKYIAQAAIKNKEGFDVMVLIDGEVKKPELK